MIVLSHVPQPVVIFDDKPALWIDKTSDGTISVSVNLFDANGNEVLELSGNTFILNPNAVMRVERKNWSSLSILDMKGNDIIDMHLQTKKLLIIDGIFFYSNDPLVVKQGLVQRAKLILANDLFRDTPINIRIVVPPSTKEKPATSPPKPRLPNVERPSTPPEK